MLVLVQVIDIRVGDVTVVDSGTFVETDTVVETRTFVEADTVVEGVMVSVTTDIGKVDCSSSDD